MIPAGAIRKRAIIRQFREAGAVSAMAFMA